MSILKVLFVVLFIAASLLARGQGRVDNRKRPDIFSSTITMPGFYGRSTDSMLLLRIVGGIDVGAIHAYADSGFTHLLSAAEVDSIARTTEYVDTFLFPHPESREETMVLASREGSFFATRMFRMLVQLRPELKFVALGIDRECSLPEYKSELGSPAPHKDKKTLFWVPYGEVRTLLADRDAAAKGKKFSDWIREIIAEQQAGY